MSFIPIDSNNFVNTDNIDYVGQEVIDGKSIVFIKSGGDRLIVAEDKIETVINVVRNQGKEEGNFAGR